MWNPATPRKETKADDPPPEPMHPDEPNNPTEEQRKELRLKRLGVALGFSEGPKYKDILWFWVVFTCVLCIYIYTIIDIV